MEKTTLVTGASGHIGSHIVAELVKKGRPVRAMVRPTSCIKALDPLRCNHLQIVEGDLLDKESLDKAVDGCESVFQAAAIFQTRGVNEDLMWKSNVDGTENILKSCIDKNVRKVVYTSSVAAIGCSRNESHFRDETYWNEDPIDTYVASKTEGEKRAQELMVRSGLNITFCNPGTVLGPGDYRKTPSNDFILLAMKKPSPVFYPGGHSYASVSEVAKAHVAAEEKGRRGERYILAGQNIDMKSLFDKIAQYSHGKTPMLEVGHKFVEVAGAGFELLGWLTQKPPLVTRKKAHKLVNYYGYFTSGKAEKELGYKTVPIDQLLEDCKEWFASQGWLSK